MVTMKLVYGMFLTWSQMDSTSKFKELFCWKAGLMKRTPPTPALIVAFHATSS